MKHYELIIVGGGAAGMLCAIEAKTKGIQSIALIEKEDCLGGALNLGDYNIGGTHNITGKEFKENIISAFYETNATLFLNSTALQVTDQTHVILVNPNDGQVELCGDKIIIATGAKEKNRSTFLIPGDRCSGIYSLGTAKKILVGTNASLGKEIVIVGVQHLDTIISVFQTRDIKVKAIINPENEPFDSSPFSNATIYNGYHIKEIAGFGRIDHLLLSNGQEDVTLLCDTLLFATGWLSDGVLCMKSNMDLNPETTGPKINENYETCFSHVYACGNGIFIHNTIEEIQQEVKKLFSSL